MSISGAEHAPIVGHNEDHTLGDVRRLSYSDPDDMRAIWRRAALTLGASDVEAMNAVLLLDYFGRHLTIASLGHSRRLWSAPPDSGYSVELATAALCRAVWGPK